MLRKIVLAFFILCVISANAADLPYFADSKAIDDSGFTAVNAPASAAQLRPVVVRTGQAAIIVHVLWSDETETPLRFAAVEISHDLKSDGVGSFSAAKKGERIALPDAAVEVKIQNRPLFWHVRPNLRRFHSGSTPVAQYAEILAAWNELPPASRHPLRVEFRKVDGGAQLFLDGSYVRTLNAPEGASLKGVTYDFEPGTSWKLAPEIPAPDPAFCTLDVTANPRVRSFLPASGNFPTGFRKIDNVPAFFAPANRAADLGLCRQGQGNWALEVDEYLMRQPEDAFPSAVCWRVPAAPYYRVWFAFALDPDEAKVPALTARLTKYVDPGVGINRIADTDVIFDPERLKSCRQIGTIAKDGKTLPVYWTSLTLDVGKISDLVFNRSWREDPCAPAVAETDQRGGDFLDFEFLGPKVTKIHQTDDRCKPDENSKSSVQILAATLQTAPVMFDFVESQPGNVFLPGEDAKLTVVTRPACPGRCQIRWKITDIDGKKVGEGASGAESFPIGLRQPVGFYWLDVACADAGGQELYRHRTSFSILPKDDRRAGFDSPYTMWWFCGVHFTTDSIQTVGTLYKKAGIRSTNFVRHSEAEMAEFNLSLRQATLSPAGNLTYLQPDRSVADAELTDAGREAVDKQMSMLLEKYPHLREVCVFHESCPGAIPYELFGEDHIWQEGEVERYTKYAAMVNAVGKYMRAKYPRIRLVVGNTGPSIAAAATVCRFGADPKFIDFLGSEATCQQYHPERLVDGNVQSKILVAEIPQVFLQKKIPVSGCYEFSSRTNRMLGYRRQAEWYVRDMLLCLLNNYQTISIGSIIEPGNSYYNTLWGNGGVMHRSPYANPKPAYQALAVMTNVLDQVRFKRRIPTGSTTVYAAEFQRQGRTSGDGPLAAVFWTPRGSANLKITFQSPQKVRIIDIWGRERSANGAEVRLEASESVTYLLSDAPVQSVEILDRAFPEDAHRAESAVVCCPLDSAENLCLSGSSALDTHFNGNPIYWPVRKRASFAFQTVEDDQRGKCVELSIDPRVPEKWTKFITEYTRLELPTNSELPSGEMPMNGIGVWVRGNSNWGRIMFEIQDADGEIWRSTGEGGWGCDAFDWPGFACVNFDGWNFVSVPLRMSDFYNTYGPGAAESQWQFLSGPADGNRKLDGPVVPRALYLEWFRQKLDLLDFQPTTEPIRLQNLSVF